MSKNEKLTELTPEQEAKIPEYLERFKAIGLSTEPTDRAKAEAAVRRSYEYLSKQNTCVPNPEIIWAESPMKGIVLAAQHAKGSLNVTNSEIQAQASLASYGSFEAYWASTYLFITNELPVEKDELSDIVYEIIQHCGVYWTFEDLVIMTPKPCKIEMKEDKLHSTTGMALQYANGDGLYSVFGERKDSLMEAIIAARNSEAA